MKSLSFAFVLVITITHYSSLIDALPRPVAGNPNAEYELISGGPQVGPKPMIVPITRKPLIINTPPPAPADSKNFAFEPNSNTWTQVKKDDPVPAEGTLIWNQNNDKWLTETARRI